MKLDGTPARILDSIRGTHVAEVNRVLIVVVDAGQRAVLREVVVRRIPHLRDRIVGVTDAAVNLPLVRFPKSLVRLPAQFARWVVLALLDGSVEIRREVVANVLEQWQGNVADAVVSVNTAAFASMFDDDGDTVGANLYIQHFGVVLD